MAAIEDLAARVFAARNAAHRAHWKTGSLSAHLALGDFYDGVIDAIDEVIEVYQGAFGLIEPFAVTDPSPDSIVSYLTAEAEWIEANRDAAANGSTAVANLIDTLLAVYRRNLYKLTQLS